MQVYEYPEEYKRRMEAECNEKIREMQLAKEKSIRELEERSQITVEKMKKEFTLCGPFSNFMIFLIILSPFFSCCLMCFTGGDASEGVAIFVVVAILAAIVAVIYLPIATVFEKRKQKAFDAECAETEAGFQRDIENVTRTCEQACTSCRTSYNAMIENQKREFDEAVQQQSVRFANSPLAHEIVEWMTNGFSRMIDTTDRREHIQYLKIDFNFKIYTNKITCNLGTYDFDIHRCDRLNYVQMAALAKSLASSIELNIRMKYQQDISGTPIEIHLVSDVKENTGVHCGTPIEIHLVSDVKENTGVHCDTTITYMAYNGYFRTTKQW